MANQQTTNPNQPQFNNRTLYSFRSTLIGGGARPNLFECEIAFPNITGVDNPGNTSSPLGDGLRFLIKAAQLPGSTIGSIPVPFRGRTLKVAGDRTYDPWTITVINDTNFVVRNAFEQWNNALSRHDDNVALITPSQYQADILIKQLTRGTLQDTTGGDASKLDGSSDKIPVLKSYKLFGCFPTSIDPIPLSYDSTDSIEEFNVTFEVQYMNAYSPNTTTTAADGTTTTNNNSIFNINDNGSTATSIASQQ